VQQYSVVIELALNHPVQGLLDLVFNAKPRKSGIYASLRQALPLQLLLIFLIEIPSFF